MSRWPSDGLVHGADRLIWDYGHEVAAIKSIKPAAGSHPQNAVADQQARDSVARAHARVIHGHQRAIEVIQSCAWYVGKPGIGAHPKRAVRRRQQKTYGNFFRNSGAQTNLGEVLSIKPGQSAVRSHPKESIPGLRNGIYLVVRQALFDGEIGAQIAACLRIKRQRLPHEPHLQDEYTNRGSPKPGLVVQNLPAPMG